MSHVSVIAYGIIMAGFSVGLHYAGISMGWLYVWMGVMISAAVLPAALTLLWKHQNTIAATASPVLGLICALIAWTVTCYREYDGVLTVETLGSNNPMLAGNVVALLSPLIFVPLFTFAFGKANYDWTTMSQIRLGDDDVALTNTVNEKFDFDTEAADGSDNVAAERRAARITAMAEEERRLHRASKVARLLTVGMTVAMLILWPMPMYGSGYVFSRKFFTGWVVVGIIWLWGSAMAVGVYPLWEGRHSIVRVVKGMLGMKSKATVITGAETPVEQPVEPAATNKA